MKDKELFEFGIGILACFLLILMYFKSLILGILFVIITVVGLWFKYKK